MQDDQLELGEDRVRDLFEAISAGYHPPAADLVPEALAGARRATRRRVLAATAGVGALAAVGSLAFALADGTSASAPLAAGSGGTSQVVSSQAATPFAKECTGVYLPWSGGSEASFYGKGSNAQRTTICEQDLAALTALLPGVTVTQNTQPYGIGAQSGEIMPDQIAQMGSGMKADTPVLNPWQYNLSAHGEKDILNVEYSRDTTALGLCSPCAKDTPLAHGFRLVDVIQGDVASRSTPAGVQIKTPQGESIVIYISTLSPQGAQTVDPVKLVEQPGFTAMLAADLAIIGDN